MTHALQDVTKFLLGEGPLDGVWYSEPHPTERGAFWWRKHLRSALAQQGEQQPVACQHSIADARSPVVKSGYICVKCGALFHAADHTAAPAAHQGEPVAWPDEMQPSDWFESSDQKQSETAYCDGWNACLKACKESTGAGAAPAAKPKTDTEQINQGCRYVTDLMAPAAQPDARKVIEQMVEALEHASGCFQAAESEGLHEAIAETQDERLKDLVERRLMYAPEQAQAAIQAGQKWLEVNK